MKNSKIYQVFLLFFLLLAYSDAASFTYSSCSSSTILSVATLQCSQCPTNNIPNNYQPIPTSCICAYGYESSSNGNCIFVSSTCTAYNDYINTYSLNGAVNSSPTCQTCSSNAYPNSNSSACVPCATGMTYNTSKKTCDCTVSNFIRSDLGCFSSTLNPSASTSNTNYYQQLAYLIPACSTFGDYLSCSYLVNLCVYSLGLSTAPECLFFPTYSLTSYIYSDNTQTFSLTATKGGSLNLKLISYLSTGNYVGQKSMQLNDIFRCGTPISVDTTLYIGSQISTSCSFNFNNLVNAMSSTQYSSYVYELLIQGDSKSYFEVFVFLPQNSQPMKRFFLQDTTTYSNKINVLTSLQLTFSLNSDGTLGSPSLYPTYTLLSLEAGSGVISPSPIQTINYSIIYNTSLSSFWTGAIISFIIICVIALIHTIGKTYIGYLNRKSALLFFLNYLNVWSLWMFYYLLFISGYWFLFTKTTATIYILTPQSNQFYVTFYVVAGLMGLMRILCVIIDKIQKLNTEVFMINWQRGQFKNSWRQIFIVSSLAEFFTNRTISLFWMLLVLLFFMTGLHWENLAFETVSTDLSAISALNPQNRVLLYFLSCAIFLAIGIVFKILRRLSVLVWPYPFEDFVDYCNVTNISFFFIKKRSPLAYYIHASIPDRTQVTYKEINQAIRRGIQKNRSISQQIPNSDSLKMYLIYMCKQLEDKFNQMIRKTQDQEHAKRMKYNKEGGKKRSNLREDFIEAKLKPYLDSISGGQNDGRTKSLFQSTVGLPTIDLRDENALRGRNHVLFDDKLDLVSEIFPNGDEVEQIHTFIIIYLMWILLTNSSPIAAFLTFFVDEMLFNKWISYQCRENLENMTRVKRGFML